MKAYVTKFILNVMYAQIYIDKHGKQKNQKQNFILKFSSRMLLIFFIKN